MFAQRKAIKMKFDCKKAKKKKYIKINRVFFVES